MENLGWGFSPTLDSGPVFTGDPCLPEPAYPFLRRKLDGLLRGRFPAVQVVFVWRTPGAGPGPRRGGAAG
jgi:hypothetical protein